MIVSFLVLALAASAQSPPNPPAKTVSPPSAPPAMQAPETGAQSDGALKVSQAFFISPKDGDKVSRDLELKFGVENMQAAAAGKVEPGKGHFHLTIDGTPVKKGQKIPSDAKHIHFAAGQSEGKVKLTPGAHTLTLQFADGAHRSYGELMSQTIKIEVE